MSKRPRKALAGRRQALGKVVACISLEVDISSSTLETCSAMLLRCPSYLDTIQRVEFCRAITGTLGEMGKGWGLSGDGTVALKLSISHRPHPTPNFNSYLLLVWAILISSHPHSIVGIASPISIPMVGAVPILVSYQSDQKYSVVSEIQK